MSFRNVLFMVALVVVCGCVIVYFPKLQLLDVDIADARVRIELENQLRITITQALGGFFLLIGIYIGWRRIIATEKSVLVSQQKQISERFTRAIDQLASTDENCRPRIEIRLGAIYGLERIAREALSEDDFWHFWQVIEILTAYIRQNAPWHPNQAKKCEDDRTRETPKLSLAPFEPWQFIRPSIDMQAILDVLGRNYTQPPKSQDFAMNLFMTNLEGAVLKDAKLNNIDLGLSRLERAVIIRTELTKANFAKANLYCASLCGSVMKNANLMQANCEGANFSYTDLSHALLMGANFKGANFENAVLAGANFALADLQDASGLKFEQLSSAETLYNTIGIEPALKLRITETSPNLFERYD